MRSLVRNLIVLGYQFHCYVGCIYSILFLSLTQKFVICPIWKFQATYITCSFSWESSLFPNRKHESTDVQNFSPIVKMALQEKNNLETTGVKYYQENLSWENECSFLTEATAESSSILRCFFSPSPDMKTLCHLICTLLLQSSREQNTPSSLSHVVLQADVE